MKIATTMSYSGGFKQSAEAVVDMEKAGLDWTVEKVKSFVEWNGQKIATGDESLVRKDLFQFGDFIRWPHDSERVLHHRTVLGKPLIHQERVGLLLRPPHGQPL